jgi:hypothetical protein
VSAKTLQASIRDWVESGATVYTDQATGYLGLGSDFDHKSVNHGAGEYINGDVHTNGIENFWALSKRAWKGTYTHNMPKNTERYIAERTFSFNNRESTDLERMTAVASAVAGRRLTYIELKA